MIPIKNKEPQNCRYQNPQCTIVGNMGVSKNRGTPKSSILIGFSIINHPFWGTLIFGNTHISSMYILGIPNNQEYITFRSFVGEPPILPLVGHWHASWDDKNVPRVLYVPWSKVAMLGMVISPLIGNAYNWYTNPYYWVDDHPLYGKNGSLDPSTYAVLCNALQYGVVLCTTLFESSSKKGRVRNRMGSANRMDNVQQVAINSCRHIVLVYLCFTF